MSDDRKRLSVNVGPAPVAALDRVVAHEGCTLTDAVNRLAAYGIFAYETTVAGEEMLIRSRDTGTVETVRIVNGGPST